MVAAILLQHGTHTIDRSAPRNTSAHARRHSKGRSHKMFRCSHAVSPHLHPFHLSWCRSKGPYEPYSVAECPQAPLLRHCLSRTRIRGRSKRRGPDLTEKDLPGLVVERSTTWRFRAQGAGAGQMKVNVPRWIFRTLRIVGGVRTALMHRRMVSKEPGC